MTNGVVALFETAMKGILIMRPQCGKINIQSPTVAGKPHFSFELE